MTVGLQLRPQLLGYCYVNYSRLSTMNGAQRSNNAFTELPQHPRFASPGRMNYQ